MNVFTRSYKYLIIIELLFLVFLSPSTAVAQDTPNNFNSVVLISWDGVQTNHLYELRNQIPILGSFINEGGINPVLVTDHITDTDSGHAEMLTGFGPDITFIYENDMKTTPDGITIFENLNYFGISTGFISGRQSNIPNNEVNYGHAFPDVLFANAKPEIDEWYSPIGNVSEEGTYQWDDYAGYHIDSNVIEFH